MNRSAFILGFLLLLPLCVLAQPPGPGPDDPIVEPWLKLEVGRLNGLQEVWAPGGFEGNFGRLRVRASRAAWGTWVNIIGRVYVRNAPPAFYTRFPYLAKPERYYLDADDWFGGQVGAPPLVVDDQYWTTVGLLSLFPVDENLCKETRQIMLKPGPGAVHSGTSVRKWDADYPYWAPLAKSWWQDLLVDVPGVDSYTFNFQKMAELLILAQSAGDLDDSFFDSKAYRTMYTRGDVVLVLQCSGLIGTDPALPGLVPDNDQIDPPGILGWDTYIPDWNISNPVPITLSGTRPLGPWPDWWPQPFPSWAITLCFCPISRGQPFEFPLQGRIPQVFAQVRWGDDSVQTLPVLSAGPGRGKIIVPVGAPTGMATIEQLQNDWGTTTLLGLYTWTDFNVVP